VSVEKLLTYSDRLKMRTTITVRANPEKHPKKVSKFSRFQSFKEKAGVVEG
jgi:hypothetical protein